MVATSHNYSHNVHCKLVSIMPIDGFTWPSTCERWHGTQFYIWSFHIWSCETSNNKTWESKTFFTCKMIHTSYHIQCDGWCPLQINIISKFKPLIQTPLTYPSPMIGRGYNCGVGELNDAQTWSHIMHHELHLQLHASSLILALKWITNPMYLKMYFKMSQLFMGMSHKAFSHFWMSYHMYGHI
jgi:hypothetical protein